MAVKRYRVALSPAIVATIVTAEQLFTITGLTDGNINSAFCGVSKPTHQSGGMPVQARVSSATQIGITFVNPTAAGVTPTAGEVYQVVIVD